MIQSPCVNICRMNEAHGVCVGCYRTLDEIARWIEMSDDDRAQLLIELRRRRDRIGELAPNSVQDQPRSKHAPH